MLERTGQQFGNYRLARLLGQGSFAEVYLGVHIHLGTQAAIKVLNARLASDETARFQEEARTIAHFRHPHIVRVLEFGVEGGTPFLVMDFAQGGTMRQRAAKGTRLPLASVLTVVEQTASALQYAHDRRVIHRDVKPENMLLGESGEVLLSDFGIAVMAQSSRYQGTQEVAGTIAYMAPEQIQGHPRPASDQYSLAVVIYEWLAGERPFEGSMGEVVARQLALPPPPLREKVPGISSAVEEVILQALTKDPKQRFSSVSAFAQSLEQASQGGSPLMFAPTQRIAPSIPTAPPPAGVPGGWSDPAQATIPASVPPAAYHQSLFSPSPAPQTPVRPLSAPGAASPTPSAPAPRRSYLAISGFVVALLLLVLLGGLLVLGFAGKGPFSPLGANPTSPPSAPGVNFQVSPQSFSQACGNGALDPLNVTLDNTGSTIAVNWQVQISDTDPAGNVWATASPTSHTTAAGGQDTLTITPRSFLCSDLNSSATFTAIITYGPSGATPASIIVSDAVTPAVVFGIVIKASMALSKVATARQVIPTLAV